MLRRIISNPLFYLILLGGCIALILSARSVNAFSWLGVWTSNKQIGTPVEKNLYQKKSSTDNSVIGVTMLHLELTQKNTATTISFNQAVGVLQKSDALLANNVISYLQSASNKRLALETYTKNIDRTLTDAQQARSSLQLDHDTAAQEYQSCASSKSAADNQFFQGLRTIDGGMLQAGYDDALEYGTCEASARISTNAYQAVITRMDSYTSALSQLNTLLTSNEDMIVANVDLFKDNYLEKLVQIRDNLESMVTSSSAVID